MSNAFELYVAGLGKKDFSGVPFADDVRFEGIMDQTDGEAAFLALCEGFFGMIGEIRVHRSYHNANGGTIVYEFDSPAGTIPIVDVVDVRDGKIARMQPFFNPMPLIALQQNASA